MFSNNTIKLRITNTTNEDQQWFALGNNKYENPPGVFVFVNNEPVDQAVREMASQSFLIEKIKVEAQSNDQLYMPITIKTSDVSGNTTKAVEITPGDYKDIIAGIGNVVTIYNPDLKMQWSTLFTGPIMSNQTLVIILTVKKIKTFSDFLSNIAESLFGKTITVHGDIPPGSQIILE